MDVIDSNDDQFLSILISQVQHHLNRKDETDEQDEHVSPSVDGESPVDDQVPTCYTTQEHDLDGMKAELDPKEEDDDQEHESRRKRRNVCFFIFYCSFLILYILCVLVIAFTYPLKPTCEFFLVVPGFGEDGFPNPTQETEKSILMNLTISSRNRLISSSYDPINITIYYLPTKDTSVHLASTIAPGFYKKETGDHTVMNNVGVPAPGLPVLWRSQRPFDQITLRLDLEFTVRFTCKAPCHRTQRFFMSFDV